jgi:hypothetical protein
MEKGMRHSYIAPCINFYLVLDPLVSDFLA